MFATQLSSAARAARRVLPSLGLAAALLLTGLAAPVTTLAQPPIIHDHRMGGPPVAHVQVTLNSMYIYDDRDWGDGEFEFWFSLLCFEITSKCLGYQAVGLDGFGRNFSAGSKERYTFDVTLPAGAPTNYEFRMNPEFGYPLRPDHYYELRFGMNEKDQFSNWEKMGQGTVKLAADNNWGIGTHTVRSVRDDGSPGDYELTFEVRPVVLPDLRPVNIKVQDIPGSTKKRVCTAVQNIEPGNVGAFEVSLHVDGSALVGGVASAPGLTPGNATEVCAEPELPASGEHKLMAVVDQPHAIGEYNEANNVYEQSYTGTGLVPGASPSPGPILVTGQNKGRDQADLTVSGIRINGQVPDGKDDCKDGKNLVTAIVKNAGTADAGTFAVRLAVDGAEPREETVDGLDAGKELEIRFDEVRLKKGEHKLAATADAKSTVAESNEDNNARTVTARCSGGE